MSILSSDRELAKSSLPLLVQILHEHTTDDIRKEQTLQQFTTKFLSEPKVKRRFHASQILQTIVENAEISPVLGTLRSIIEDLYKQSSDPQFRSTIPFDDLLAQLVSDLREFLYKAYYSPTHFDTFQRLGGVLVLLDVLFLDHRLFQNQTSNIHQWSNLREVTILLIDRLIHYVKDVKNLFFRSKPLLALLAQIYRTCESSSIRNTIANTFKTLEYKTAFMFRTRLVDYHDSRIVEYFTENAIELSKTRDNDTELVNTLEAISALTDRNPGCQADFLAVPGSMDLLIDVFEDDRQIDWNWTIGYWSYDFGSLIDFLRKDAAFPWLLSFIASIIIGPSNFTVDKWVDFIFWMFRLKSYQAGFNYYRAKYAISRPNLGRVCSWIAIHTAILIKYLLWFAFLLFCFKGWFPDSIVPKLSRNEAEALFYYLVYAIIHFAQLSFKPPRKLRAAGDILRNLKLVFNNNPGAVWRFRQRGAYQLLTRYSYIWTIDRDDYLRALRTIQNHALWRPETKAERRRVKKFRKARKVGMIRRCIDKLHRVWVIWTIWRIP